MGLQPFAFERLSSSTLTGAVNGYRQRGELLNY